VNDNVYPLDRIRGYRVEVSKREVASHLYRVAKFCLEASTVLAIAGRGLQFMSRELGYDNPRRIRFPAD
jgi:hypothetical protein